MTNNVGPKPVKNKETDLGVIGYALGVPTFGISIFLLIFYWVNDGFLAGLKFWLIAIVVAWLIALIISIFGYPSKKTKKFKERLSENSVNLAGGYIIAPFLIILAPFTD